MNLTAFDVFCATIIAGLIRPAKKIRTYKQFLRTLKVPDGPDAGKPLNPEREPAQMRFIDAVDARDPLNPLRHLYHTLIHCAPTQRGKTLIAILGTWLYSIIEEKFDFGYIMPNLDKLDQNWETKLKPGIKGSGYGFLLPEQGPGSKGGRPPALPMFNPHTKRSSVTSFMAAGSEEKETSLAAVSPARVGLDEVDDFTSAGQVKRGVKRLESWRGRGRAFLASTVNNRTNRDEHPILDMVNDPQATNCRVTHRCPLCRHHQVIKFEQLDLETARLRCSNAACGALWTEDQRHEAIDEGDEVGGYSSIIDGQIVPNGATFDYHMSVMQAIVDEYLTAKDAEKIGKYKLMETFKHKVLCEPYSIPVDDGTVTDRMLSIRSSRASHGRGVVPDDATRLVVTVDVQGDRIYWLAMASGTLDRRWIIDWGEWFWTAVDPTTNRIKEPTDEDRHAVLAKLLNRARDGWPRLNGQVIGASLIGVDIGHNPNGSIGRWINGKQGVVAMRGEGSEQQVAETIDGRKATFRVSRQGSDLLEDHGLYEIREQSAAPDQPRHWWFIRSQSLREHVAARLRQNVDAEDSLMLPKGVPENDPLIKHMTAWVIVRDEKTAATMWVQKHVRDDYGDCNNMGTALLTVHNRKRGGVVGKVAA